MNAITLSILNLITSQIEDFSLSEIDLTLILNKLTEIQNSISSLSIQNEPIATAPIILPVSYTHLTLPTNREV